MRTLRNTRGFTLIELMIVVVIIGILAAIAIPKFSAVTKSAKEAEAPPILKQIRSLELSYYQENDAYATSVNDLSGFDPSGVQGKYYTFSVDATGTCGVATPIDASVVTTQSIDVNSGTLFRTASCT